MSRRDLIAALAAAGIGRANEQQTSPREHQPYFPSLAHQLVYRNWDLLPPERIAAALRTNRSTVLRLASHLYLPQPVELMRDDERTRFHVLRRNWLFVPLEQIAELLRVEVAEIEAFLMTDDFYPGHLGPQPAMSAPVQVEPALLSAAPVAELRDVRQTHMERRFAFEERLSAPLPGFRPQTAKRSDAAIGYPCFGIYGDVLSHRDYLRYYPKGVLQRMLQQGLTAVWVHAKLRDLVRDPLFETTFPYSPERLERLRRLVAHCRSVGLDVYVYLNEPRGAHQAFFERHPELRGAPARVGSGLWSLCTSQPATLEWLRTGTRSLLRAVPDLGGLILITASENPTNCFSLTRKPDCPRCSKRSGPKVIAEVVQAIRDGAHSAKPGTPILAWDWSWNIIEDDPQREIINALPDGVSLLVDFERGTPIERAGAKSVVDEYSLSVPGPSPRATAHIEIARSRNLHTMGKLQIGTTWELGTLPFIPVPGLVAQKLHGFARSGLRGGMFSWTLGMFPSVNWDVAARMIAEPGADPAMVVNSVAAERYGSAAPVMRKAWAAFEEAFQQFPFSIPVVYSSFVQQGAAQRLYLKPTGRPAAILNSADSLDWTHPFGPERTASLFAEIGRKWHAAVAELRTSKRQLSGDTARAFARDTGIMEAAALQFEAVALLVRFYLMRNAGATGTPEFRANLERQIVNAQRLLALCRADSRIGFEPQSGYMFTPLDIREKIAACRYQLRSLAG